MKNIIYIAAFVVTGAWLFCSCDDFLEAENKSAGGALAEEYYSTDAGLQTFLASAYAGLKPMATMSRLMNGVPTCMSLSVPKILECSIDTPFRPRIPQ